MATKTLRLVRLGLLFVGPSEVFDALGKVHDLYQLQCWIIATCRADK